MNRRIAFLLLVFVVLGCERAPEAPAQTQTRAEQDDARPLAAPIADLDGDNLLNVAYGAAVVSRTAELNLETSAMHAIDGMSFTVWTTPPSGPSQTLVFAFGGTSRVEQLGVTTAQKDQSPETVRFSASSDGKSWREIIAIQPSERRTTMMDVPPFDARYLRVETIEPKEQYATIASFHAVGRELAPPPRLSFDGCWDVNMLRATFVQRGARITGAIAGAKSPTYVDGGVEGRVARLMWMRGAMWGYAVATLTPGANGISAITFHEDPIFSQFGEAWIGGRCSDRASTIAPLAPAEFLRRAGRWTMSGIVFDGEERLIHEPSRGTLDAAAALIRSQPSQRFRITAREYRNNDPAMNQRVTVARIEAVRAALRARGVDLSRVEFAGEGSKPIEYEMPSAVQRMLWSRIDLSAVGR